jgi:hypothetical protein
MTVAPSFQRFVLVLLPVTLLALGAGIWIWVWWGPLEQVLTWMLFGLVGLYVLIALVAAALAPLHTLTITEDAVRIKTVLHGEKTIRWPELKSAILRVRRSTIGPTRRTLLLCTEDQMFWYPVWLLSRSDGRNAIRAVNRHFRVRGVLEDHRLLLP